MPQELTLVIPTSSKSLLLALTVIVREETLGDTYMRVRGGTARHGSTLPACSSNSHSRTNGHVRLSGANIALLTAPNRIRFISRPISRRFRRDAQR
jgi:hypothetical protein